tara:strand:- start:120 stop:989 length:870 start_codon:yes stop_codon:yes gene_type:complete
MHNDTNTEKDEGIQPLPNEEDHSSEEPVEVGGDEEVREEIQSVVEAKKQENRWNYDLKNLFDTIDNPNRKKFREYDDLEEFFRENSVSSDDQEQYAENWNEPRYLSDENNWNEKITPHIKGKTLIDLGGGREPSFQDIAKRCGADWYVNIDRHLLDGMDHTNSPWRDVAYEFVDEEEQEPMKVSYTHAELLSSISLLEDETSEVVLVLNGIDDHVINDTTHRRTYGKGYHDVLAKEIVRVLPKGGAVLTCGSTASDFFEDLGLKLARGYEKSWNLPELWVKPEDWNSES